MDEYILKVKVSDAPGAVNDLLKGLLESGKVSAVLAMQETPSGKAAFPTMVSDPEKLNLNVFAPLLPVSTATIVSRMTRIKGADSPVAVVLRNCELRTLTELCKLNQADLMNLILIGVDCPGTFDINTFSHFPGKGTPTDAVLDGNEKNLLRSACASCKDPVPEKADLVIGLFGVDVKKELYLGAGTEAGKGLLEGLDLDKFKDARSREKAVADVRKKADAFRTGHIKAHSEIKGIGKIAEFFDSCINCHNCMNVCPICYCKECLFDSAVFDMEAGKYLNKAKVKGAFKTPTDSILFHITRFNHMILSCVQCGLCEQACPSNIPLMDIIIPIAENAQKEFEYLPGRDPEEQLPMIVYREEEFEDVGER
ncbi:MAG: 4Fe-4S dicluster domain-containing protein [Candidatus Thermoplasmatota archaeon]|nr:4Fe-4S dicluster domain-containing protein [Candidatus Thermoplasmatota archaeon]